MLRPMASPAAALAILAAALLAWPAGPAEAAPHRGDHGSLTRSEPAAVIQRHGVRVEIHADFDRFKLPRSELLAWIGTAVDAVHTYYDAFPVKKVSIYIHAFAGGGIQNGTAYGSPEPHITVSVGDETEASDLHEDWKMTHEFVHMAVPIMKQGQSWLDEGIATYVEPLARYQAGKLDEDQIWSWLIKGVPHALGERAAAGLDDTRNWGTTYWGGALFCLLADIQIRQATDNKKGLQDALRLLVKDGNVILTAGDAPVLFRQADKALGITVLTDLYQRFKASPYQVEPAFLWRRLGISLTPEGKVLYDDEAPWAPVRRAIVQPEAVAQ